MTVVRRAYSVRLDIRLSSALSGHIMPLRQKNCVLTSEHAFLRVDCIL